MYIQVRTIDASAKMTLDVSKTTRIAELKAMLEPHFNIKPEEQRLFFRGKQLDDHYSLFDYSINLNDMIQIMKKVAVEPSSDAIPSTSNDYSEKTIGKPVESSKYFKVGEYIDAKDSSLGAWFEGKITKIYKDTNYEENKIKYKDDETYGAPYDGYFYEVGFGEENEPHTTEINRLCCVRPRAQVQLPLKELNVGDCVLVNYNIEEPTKRGYWYDAVVTEVKDKKKGALTVDITVGLSAKLTDCIIAYKDDIFKMEEIKPVTERIINTDVPPPSRFKEEDDRCSNCNNNPRRNCKVCGCKKCGLKTDEDKQLMCDECDDAYHIWCLTPPLEEVPADDDWYCHECKNDENEIVTAGSKLKLSKKKINMASKQNNTNRDWGKGMACVARTKVCTIVPQNHFGPIPGIEVGTLWKYRIQVAESGVHRPHVAGIHGRETLGAFSVVLSGGYEDDIDNGDEVYYTGSGGRDLSGNKRTNAQGFDQKLSRLNKALALNCNVKLNEKGAEAKDWRAGKPVRVVRNYKLSKHSKYAPEDGNRYDGIYKVVKYFPEQGKSGFTVWRFLFRRDDPVPAPWTKEGKKRIKDLGLEMQYPDGYVESGKLDNPTTSENVNGKGGKGKKRVLEESPNRQPETSTKKAKVLKYELEDALLSVIEKDAQNEKLWDECKQSLDLGKLKFVAKVEEVFTCICCTELVYKPVTTSCHHNFCSECIKRSFKADVMTCPTCRNSLEKGALKNINSHLQEALIKLFPGYTAGR